MPAPTPSAWLEEEETLLKEKLQGMKVVDRKAPAPGRDVGVWFRFPEPELTPTPERQLEGMYPFVTIDLIGVSEALDRAHRGGRQRPTVTGYRPPDMVTAAAAGKVFVTEWPVAMNLDFQVTTWARNIQHDRQILRQMWVKFPGRYGSLGGNAVPYVRPFSCQLMNMVPGDRLDEFGKRQFRKMFTLRVFSEIWSAPVKELTEITSVDITLPLNVASGDWFSEITCYEE